MRRMLEVDVGVVTFETRDLTVSALEHLMQNSAGVRLRVLVHDNASSDGTAAEIAHRFPHADVDVSDRNLGFGAGMNRLLARSSAPWFLALNSDAWPEPGAIARMLEVGRANPTLGVVAPRLERPDGTFEHSIHPFPSLRVAAMVALGSYRRLWPRTSRRLALNGAWDHDEPRDVDWAVGAALLIRRTTIEAVGGFDESFFMYAEDLEWCWRVRQGGWSIRFEPSAVVRHVGNASGARTYGEHRTRAHIHNAHRFYRRVHGPASTAAYRSLSVAGCGRLYVLARLRGDAQARSEWAGHIRAHLSRARGTDGPPEMPRA
jgi:N-acetylglucosaminyl-diphospho-decaprenol L-rhamnosyltransferase